ncbi:recombinase family protein [Bradyrhizobium sp. Arg314]
MNIVAPFPTGFIYNEVGDVVLDPDAQIREMITHFFETFSRVGSATQTVKAFASEGLLFPSRFRNSKRVVFQPLTTSGALRTLHNPRYAGAYAYGQRLYRRTVDGKKQVRKREPNEWLACIPDAHPGYISWEQFQHNLTALEANGQSYQTARVSPPREGAALLQGRVICGRCGCHMRARYVTRRGQVDTWYVCTRAYVSRGEPHCQSIAGWPVDAAIGELIAAEMTPAAVELALEIRKEIEARYDEADKLRLRAVERAQIDADLAQRRFMLVDPNNRLVADTLEREWNDKLRMLADLREERESALREDRATLDDAIRDRLIAMTADFNTVWCDPTLPNRERKRLLAYLVEDVTLLKFQAEGETRIHIRFRGGRTETLTTQNPKTSAQQVKTRPEVVELVDKLLDDHICAEIADILNAKGIRPGGSARRGKADAQFTDLHVIYLVKQYGLRSRYDRLRERGMLTKAEACAKLGITECTLVRWAKYGIVKRHAYNGYIYLYERLEHVPAKQSSRWNQLAHRADAIRRLNSSKCYDLKERAVV